MESFAPFIAGLNKTFYITNNQLNQEKYKVTCVYVVYLSDGDSKVYSAFATTNYRGEIRQCHKIAEDIVRAKIVASLSGKYQPVCNNRPVRLVGQKAAKTFSNFDRDVEIENHSHCLWYINGKYYVSYHIVLKYYNSNDVYILRGEGVSDDKGVAIRLARQSSELKITNVV